MSNEQKGNVRKYSMQDVNKACKKACFARVNKVTERSPGKLTRRERPKVLTKDQTKLGDE